MEVALHEAKMRKSHDGISNRKALQSVVDRGTRREGQPITSEVQRAMDDLYGPEIPEEGMYLWGHLMELDSSRQEGFSGPQPITFQTIESWCRVMDIRVQPWEAKALRTLDMILRHPEAFDDA